jgi:hypothetical protein
MPGGAAIGMIATILFWLEVFLILYCVLQVSVAVGLRGTWRFISLLPIPLMAWATVSAYRQETTFDEWLLTFLVDTQYAVLYLGLV